LGPNGPHPADRAAFTNVEKTDDPVIASKATAGPFCDLTVDYEQLLHVIFQTPRGRICRIVTTIAGKAVWQVQHLE